MAYCVMCGSPIPDDQGSSTCSMCYGDIDHGKDGYYRRYMEQQDWDEMQKKMEQEQQWQQEWDEMQKEQKPDKENYDF